MAEREMSVASYQPLTSQADDATLDALLMPMAMAMPHHQHGRALGGSCNSDEEVGGAPTPSVANCGLDSYPPHMATPDSKIGSKGGAIPWRRADAWGLVVMLGVLSCVQNGVRPAVLSCVQPLSDLYSVQVNPL
jgi:hypothetical protein